MNVSSGVLVGMWAGVRMSFSLQSLSANSHLCATFRLVCVLHTLVRGVYTLHHVCSRYGNVVVYNVRVWDGGESGQYSLGCLVCVVVSAQLLFFSHYTTHVHCQMHCHSHKHIHVGACDARRRCAHVAFDVSWFCGLGCGCQWVFVGGSG